MQIHKSKAIILSIPLSLTQEDSVLLDLRRGYGGGIVSLGPGVTAFGGVMLTEAQIKAAKPKATAYKISDNTGNGLFVRVQPNGSKLFQMKYTFKGKEKTASFGKWPTCTLAIARTKTIAFRRELLMDRDPLAEKIAAERTSKTFEEVAASQHEVWKAGKDRAHINRVNARMKRDILPAIGSRQIATLTAPDIVAMCRKIEARGVGETAKRAFSQVSDVFSHGITMGFCERNPCAEVNTEDFLKATVKRNHARVEDDELPAVLQALWSHPGIVTRMAAKLTVYTVLRTANLIGLEWEWVDLDNSRITIPRGQMKEKDSNRPAFVCVLSPQACDVLRFMREMSGNGRYAFPGGKRGEPLSNGAMLKALRDAGFGGKQTMHAFRAVFTTWAAGAGWSKDLADAQMDHAKRGVRAHYDFQQFIEQRGPMMEAWAAHVDALAIMAK